MARPKEDFQKFPVFACFTLVIALISCLTLRIQAASWYVRPLSEGSSNGTDWNNAWSLANLNSNWSNVQPGDNIWLAGGAYSALDVGKSGSSGKPIYIKRATVNDAAAVASAGWNKSFDSLVTINGGINMTSQNYITIDGNTQYGILCTMSNGNAGITMLNPCSNIQFISIDINGPGFRVTTNETNGIRSTDTVTNLLVSHCRIQNCDTQLKVGGWNNSVVEYSTFQYCSSGDFSNVHPDLAYVYPSTNLTFRYNYFAHCDIEGMFFSYGGSTQIYFYGNVFYNTSSEQDCTAIEIRQGFNYGSFFIWNNVFVGFTRGIVVDSGNSSEQDAVIDSSSSVVNNIFWNTPNSFKGTISYNGYMGESAVGSHAVTSSINPFVNSAAQDYHLVAGSWPINAGTLVGGAPYNIDPSGIIRSLTGAWDIGAYEYATGTAPNPPQNLRISGVQ